MLRRVPLLIALLAVAPTARATVLTINDDGTVTVAAPPTAAAPTRPAHPAEPVGAIEPLLAEASDRAGLARELVAAVAWVESRYNLGARSPKGAIGPMQLMPATARELGVDPRDPAANVAGGAAYLRSMLDRFDGDLIRAIAAYNAGPGAVERFAGVPPYRETRRYVAAVLDRLAARLLSTR